MSTNPFEQALKDEAAAEKRRLWHKVTINTRYGETTRDCYCENGEDHHEHDTPWFSAPGKRSTV